MENKFSRNCPNCKNEVVYSSIKNRNQAEKKLKKCKTCSYLKNLDINRVKMEAKFLKFDDERNQKIVELFYEIGSNWKNFSKSAFKLFSIFKKETKILFFYRKCPKCLCEMIFEDKYYMNLANKRNSLCGTCSKTGDKNPFFGKKHSKETLNKIQKTNKSSESWAKHLENIRTDEYRKKLSENSIGEKNPAFNRGKLEDIWLRRYGKEEADIREKKWKDKLSVNATGENNNMFGKPSPVGSGNGWSGWYKEWYFRSLRELSYMITEIEEKSLDWESGELKKYKISYIDWKGVSRNYFSDFIVNKKLMVECKPNNLQNSADVKLKKEAAEKFCKDNDMEYVIVEPKMIKAEKIKELYDFGIIKFLPRYEEKFLKNYC